MSCEWVAHTGQIWKVRWADPEFGQILASCSFDRTVRIWEEKEKKKIGDHNETTLGWMESYKIIECRESVEDI